MCLSLLLNSCKHLNSLFFYKEFILQPAVITEGIAYKILYAIKKMDVVLKKNLE